jgi:phospholipid-binding lipoprotein MlaA
MKAAAPVFLLLVLSLGLGGCSTPSPESLAQNDPWENTNRDTFALNVWLEHNVARPIDDGYRFIVPEPVRQGVHNVLINLHSPIVLANDVLQGDSGKAGNTLGRIVINSTIGLGGLIDVASKMGMPYHNNDFGITLGQNGIAEGSFLMLPVFGPMPPRDLLGSGVDGAFDPLAYARFHGKDTWMFARTGLRIADTISARRNDFESIERSSVDFYATVRNLYRQSRNAQIRGEDANTNTLPDL